jgi:cysteine synthase A
MAKIADSLIELVGNTPLLRLGKISQGTGTEICAKLEFFNPGGSVKDRPGIWMIEQAEQEGKLRKGQTLVEATSGNTGIGLAWVSVVKGYRMVITMPETASVERIRLLKLLGAQVILTPGEKGMAGATEYARELAEKNGYFMTLQFENQANPDIHEKTTGKEIWDATDGRVDAVVAGVGTGGTLMGIANCLKKVNSAIKIFAVEPAKSPVLSHGSGGTHKIEGIGAGFVPKIYRHELVDTVLDISDEDAADWMLKLARMEGVLAGISSGAAVAGAVKIAKNRAKYGLGENPLIVAILPDGVDRYLSVDWLWSHWGISRE